MNRKVYISSAFLIVLTIGLITAKIIHGGQSVYPESGVGLWRVSFIMDITGTGSRAKVRLTLPRDTEGQIIYNENFESAEMVFYTRERAQTGNRIGFWRSELLDGSKSINYTFSVKSKGLTFTIPTYLSRSKDPLKSYPQELHSWLDPSKYIQSENVSIERYLSKIIKKEKSISVIVRKIFDFVRGEVKYQSEKGSKDAKTTLEKLVADCGGQARLFVAFSRAAGIPSRLVGGLILDHGVKKTTHVWAENYIGNKWIPFDVVNNHYASIPANYLILYRGDYVLLKYVGLSRFDYFISIGRERIPPVDQPWSLYALPIHFQNLVHVLLLLPIGAVVVAFFRVIVGIPTFGTFAPILLALAFREISLVPGIICVIVIVGLGWLLRSLLDYLKILIIPRLSIIVTMVIMMVLGIILVGLNMGHRQLLYITLFPIVIITWLIERFSVLQIEDGTLVAAQTAFGTTVVAIAAYYLMKVAFLKNYLFAFPELLLSFIAILLLLGRYNGIRITELWRFYKLQKILRKK
ncbi:MAG: UUP1 family membrane protein [Candidatus Omnitrophica bacterium]|nr:UUP1 family membrane protein [Candidatus Omnitrophota bacterium]